MARFIQVGHHWINLDQVLRVEFIPTRNDKERVTTVRVYYADGSHSDFRDDACIAVLADWLRAHEAGVDVATAVKRRGK